jgi:hypothetical protein
MTLGELIDWYRPRLADESVAVRRSWEEMFTYTLRFYDKNSPIAAFDPDVLSERLVASGMHHLIVSGYLQRWRDLLASTGGSAESQEQF